MTEKSKTKRIQGALNGRVKEYSYKYYIFAKQSNIERVQNKYCRVMWIIRRKYNFLCL